MTSVPVVDLDRDPDVVGAELDEICSQVGFFQVIGHGADPAVTDAAWDAAVAFFDLPLEEKLGCKPDDPGYPYGYIPMAGESLSRSEAGTVAPPDLKEVYNAGPPVASSQVSGDEAWAWQPSSWPAALPELEIAWTAHYAELESLAARIMSLFARGLDLPADFFADRIDRPANAIRALRYPARDTPPEDGQFRAGAHTDYGTLTLLRQDTVGGLQVQTAQGWADVPSVPGAFVVNIGDLMARWTNDRWRSTLHRVVDPPAGPDGTVGRRHSMPYFANANWDTVVECLPTCLRDGERARYEPVLAGPHLMAKFRRTAVA